MTLVDEVAARFSALTAGGGRCLVAVSGGPDSLALLDLLHLGREQHGRELIVGHVDHGIAEWSPAVAAAVERAAEERELRAMSRCLSLAAATGETRARTARRAALQEIASAVDASWIILAHHADDQVETVLLRLLRGSGPAGLAAMAERTGVWLRPLLRVPRVRLADHLAERGLSGWQDPSNSDHRHLRSWLRSEVLPLLRGRLPDLTERLLTASRQAGEAREGWDQLLEELPELELESGIGGISVAAPALSGYRSALRQAVVAALGRRFGVPLGSRRLAAIGRLLEGRDATIRLAATLEAELAFGRLIFRRPPDRPPEPVPIVLDGECAFGSWLFRTTVARASTPDREGWGTAVVPGSYLIRAWHPGDRIRPLGGQGHRPVSVLLREARIAPGRRSHWPVLLAHDATIVWVPGICRSDSCIPTEGSEALCVDAAFA